MKHHLKKIDPNLIAFDIDGVVADTAEAFLRLASERHGICGYALEQITEFEVAKCLPIAPEIIDRIFADLLEDPIDADLRPMTDAVAVLTSLSRLAPLTFITARPLYHPIAQWLERALGTDTFSQVRLIAMGDHDQKAPFLTELGIRYFVDDRAETCLDLERRGFTPLVFSQPWNRGRHHLHTVSSWQEIRELCV